MTRQKRDQLLPYAVLLGIGCTFGLLAAREWQRNHVYDFGGCVRAGFPVRESFPEQCVTPSGRVFIRPLPQDTHSISLTGTIVCLPHKNPEGPQTTECVFGLQTENGAYYGLKDEDGEELIGIVDGDTVTVTGVLINAEKSEYAIVGTIDLDSLDLELD